MRVVLSDQARADLAEIGDHIAKDSPIRALHFTEELEAKALQIGDMPRAFPLLPRYEHYGIRRRTYRDYLIFYRIEDDRISVVHILHGARNYETLLFPQE